MTKLHLKSVVAILILLFIILIPGISLSQKKDQSPQKDQNAAKQLDSRNMADEPGSLNLDDLKEIRKKKGSKKKGSDLLI
jgi:septal ring-binding cell division protein DamX